MNDTNEPTAGESPAESAVNDVKEAVQNAAATPPAPTGEVPKEDRTMGMLCHLLALGGFVFPFGNILGPLIIWLVKKDENAFVADQGKEALNFQITVVLAFLAAVVLFIVGIILTVVVIGVVIMPLAGLLMTAIGIANLVFIIIATIKANDGVYYRYPFALRLIK